MPTWLLAGGATSKGRALGCSCSDGAGVPQLGLYEGDVSVPLTACRRAAVVPVGRQVPAGQAFTRVVFLPSSLSAIPFLFPQGGEWRGVPPHGHRCSSSHGLPVHHPQGEAAGDGPGGVWASAGALHVRHALAARAQPRL